MRSFAQYPNMCAFLLNIHYNSGDIEQNFSILINGLLLQINFRFQLSATPGMTSLVAGLILITPRFSKLTIFFIFKTSAADVLCSKFTLPAIPGTNFLTSRSGALHLIFIALDRFFDNETLIADRCCLCRCIGHSKIKLRK